MADNLAMEVSRMEARDAADELNKAAAMVRTEMVADADYLDDEGFKASEALAVLLEKTAGNFSRVPAGVASATLNLARAMSALITADEDDE